MFWPRATVHAFKQPFQLTGWGVTWHHQSAVLHLLLLRALSVLVESQKAWCVQVFFDKSIIMWIYVVHQGGQGFEKFCSLLSRMQHVNALTDFLYQCHKRESLSALKKSHADKVAAAIDDK